MNTVDQLLQKIEKYNSLDFGDVFSKSIELFKKVWVQGLIHTLILTAVMIPVVIVIYLAVMLGVFGSIGIAGAFAEGAFGEFSEGASVLTSILVSIISVVVFFVIMIIPMALSLAINAHFFLVCKRISNGEPEGSDYFYFLKGKYLKKVLGLSVAMLGIVFVAILLCVFPMFYAMVPLQLLVVVFAFNPDLKVSEIVSVSFKLGNKTWLVSFGLIMITALLIQTVSGITCGIGGLFVASATYLPIYYIYDEVIGRSEKDGEVENVPLIN